MDVSQLDFVLINIISYFSGIASGLFLCCKYKENFMVRSRSRDSIRTENVGFPGLQGLQDQTVLATPHQPHQPQHHHHPTAVAKITLE